ncbi:hypothetical protein GCM10011531_14430 [Aquaticitalea lipolytica]|jgi:uncharacterized membrane protein|uniref:DUF4870 domain-containing protein n=1 Tax=Aquaticitalea lipolytica TaxID=1247562 RepID=A0A8J2TSF6_9FLAO|nr:hypothetical protein [Aquaticitalea lipolytica]GFZ84693.1 hypothetical protein GCM10011531_14430 [Aquaticitalea lipolytica]
MTDQTIQEGKTLAIVSYFTLIGTLIAFFMNNEKRNQFTAFHTRQALGLWLLEMILGFVVSGFDNWMITYSFWIFIAVLFLYAIFGAITGKLYSVPLLGDFFQKLFKNIGQ